MNFPETPRRRQDDRLITLNKGGLLVSQRICRIGSCGSDRLCTYRGERNDNRCHRGKRVQENVHINMIGKGIQPQAHKIPC